MFTAIWMTVLSLVVFGTAYVILFPHYERWSWKRKMNNADKHKRQNAAEHWIEQTALKPCRDATNFFQRELVWDHHPQTHSMAQSYFAKYPNEKPKIPVAPRVGTTPQAPVKGLWIASGIDWHEKFKEENSQFKFVGDD
jgi:hypothetical protein